MKAFDTAGNTTLHVKAIKAAGVETVIRYLSEDTRKKSKNVTPVEARAIANAGLRLCLVWETYGGTHKELNATLGKRHARLAMKQAQAVGAPDGITIYFAVDTNPQGAFFQAVLQYFATVKATIGSKYKVGVYGPGTVCAALLDAGHVDKAWLANARGWSGYRSFLASKRWTILQQLPTKIAGMGVDPDIIAEGKDVGDFVPFKTGVGVEHTTTGGVVATGAVAAAHWQEHALWIIGGSLVAAIVAYVLIKSIKAMKGKK